MPNPLPFPLMNVQRPVNRLNSPALSVAGLKAVSDPKNVPAATAAWVEVPQASIPDARAPGDAAELAQDPPTGALASSLITIAVGTAGVSVLLVRSWRAESETSPLGVTGQEQQEIICSSGENAYTFTHSAPVVEALVPAAWPAPRAPEFVILITESPTLRLDAYRT
jgi:hypothetical protein